MKKFYAVTSVILFAVFALISAPKVQSNENGAALNYSGALNLGTCVQSGCHNTTAVNSGPGDVTISTNIPQEGYTPGNTYTIDVEVTDGGLNGVKYGFAISSKKVGTNTLAGTWSSLNANSQIKSSGAFATHTLAGNTGGSSTKVYNLNWTAPAVGTGKIALYVAGNSANGNGEASGDHIYARFMEFEEFVPFNSEEYSYNDIIVYPNPTKGSIFINNPTVTKLEIDIYAITGQKMLSYSTHLSQADIDVSSLTKGLYIMTIKGGKEVRTEKIIIE